MIVARKGKLNSDNKAFTILKLLIVAKLSKSKLNFCGSSVLFKATMVVKLTKVEKIEIVLIVGDNYKTHREAAVIFNNRHPEKQISHVAIGNLISKFKRTGSVDNCFKKNRPARTLNEDDHLDVLQAVIENPKVSLRKIAKTVPGNTSKSSASRILKNNNFHPYKPKFIHTLKPRDFDSRFMFCAWFQGEAEVDHFFGRRILFSDEATFTSNGVVCSQNCRWWSDVNPNFVIECRDQYYFKTNVWCGILNNEIVGPYFFRGNITADVYLNFLRNEIFEFTNQLPLNLQYILWYQHDGAPCHSAARVTEYLNQAFPRRWIGRRSEIPWPPRSPDITPLDFFLWGLLKEIVYKHRPFQDVDHLEEIIRQCVRDVTPDMIRAAVSEFSKRTIKCMERNGGHVEH